MRTIAIVFESQYGQTQKIAERVAALATARGHGVRSRRVAEAQSADLEWADAVILLAPVYNRKHEKSVCDFAIAHHELLSARPTAFFSVSLAAAIKGGGLAQRGSSQLVREFLETTRMKPVTVAALAGGLNYPAYPRGFRLLMRLAALVLGLPTDAARAHELTDWLAVERSTSEFLSKI